MNIEEINSISWKNDYVSVPFEDFYNFALKNGFKFIFTFPFGDEPQSAIAARTKKELDRIIEPIPGISGFGFK